MAAVSVDSTSLFDVRGLIVVVTGGGTGIGLMIAQALETNGAIVCILGRRQETLEKAAQTAKFGNIFPIQADVTCKDDLVRAAAQLKSKHGYVNVVIANSGVLGPTTQGLPKDANISEFQRYFLSWDPNEFDNVLSVNTTGVFFTAVAFLELLDEGNKRSGLKQRSQIIATSSIGAYIRLPVLGYAYEASKAAVNHLMKQLSSTLVPYGIRANLLAPGWYYSEMSKDVMDAQNQIGWNKGIVPEERPGDEGDMAGAILFLVSKAGAYINGNVLVTDGGRLGILPTTE